MGAREIIISLTTSVAGGRRWFTRAPQGTQMPYVIFHLLPGDRGYHNQGESGAIQQRLQCDAYALDVAAAKRAMAEVIASLSGYRGQGIQGIFFGTPRDLEASDAESVNDLARISCDATLTTDKGL